MRAQAIRPEGRLVDDFHFVKGERVLHVVNAPSPAATASLAIGERIVAEVTRMGWTGKCACVHALAVRHRDASLESRS